MALNAVEMFTATLRGVKRKCVCNTPLEESCVRQKKLNAPRKQYKENDRKCFPELNKSLFVENNDTCVSLDEPRYNDIGYCFLLLVVHYI